MDENNSQIGCDEGVISSISGSLTNNNSHDFFSWCIMSKKIQKGKIKSVSTKKIERRII